MNVGDDFADVDRLVATGQLPAAALKLETLLTGGGQGGSEKVAQWLKLAGLRRALRQPRRALDAVHAALALAPLDFVGLVMRAGLLERLDDPCAGQAWDEALAQKPDQSLAPPLAAAVAAGEIFRAGWQADRERRLADAVAGIAGAGEDEGWKVARFRDNILRKTRVYHSEPTHFFYPGLVEREFHPRNTMPWLADLEANFVEIREELLTLMRSEAAEQEPYIQYADREALAQWRPLNNNRNWTAIHLLKQGEEIAANVARAPRTMALLAQVPQPRVPGASPNAMISLLAPRTGIPPHCGVDNTRLVCHLPLVVPEGCWLRVGAETRFWREGEAFVFDDTIEHEALNPSDELRVVLIFDVWHSGLSQAERDAVAATIAAEGGGPAGG